MQDTLDAAVVRRWCGDGLVALRAHQHEIDELNVYPVPDGDTGTNLVLTLTAAHEALVAAAAVAESPPAGDADRPGDTGTPLGRTMRRMARGALLGARGNSGVIVSQILRGMADSLASVPAARGADLARALRSASEAAWAAVARPVEGTVLSVVAAAADGADRLHSDDLVAVAREAARAAAEALARTPQQLPVLARAGVVDAGGRGLCVLLDALVETLTGEKPARTEPATTDPTAKSVPAPTSAGPTSAGCTSAGGPTSAAPTAAGSTAATPAPSLSAPAAVLAPAAARAAGAGAGAALPVADHRASAHSPGASAHPPGGSSYSPGGSAHPPGGSSYSPGGSSYSPGGSAHSPGSSSNSPGGSSYPPGGSSHSPGGSSHPPGGSSHSPDGCGGGEQEGAFGYEVQYLLDAEAGAVDVLRARLGALGDSLVVVGTGDPGVATWNVHVHVDAAGIGPALEAGVEAGRPYRITVMPLDERGPTAHPDRRGAVVVAAGDGLAALFEAEGAVVVGRNPSTREVLDAITAAGAGSVVLLPNDANTHAVASTAAREADAGGVRVSVVPTRSPVQALAALAVRDQHRPFADDVIAMAEAAGACRYGEVCTAQRDAFTVAGPCRAGDLLGLVDGEVHVIGQDLAEVSRLLLDRMLGGGGELVTLVLGADAPPALEDALLTHLGQSWPFAEPQCYAGGQPRYHLLVGVE